MNSRAGSNTANRRLNAGSSKAKAGKGRRPGLILAAKQR